MHTPEEMERVDDMCEAFYKECFEKNRLRKLPVEETEEEKLRWAHFEEKAALNPERYKLPEDKEKYRYTRILQANMKRHREENVYREPPRHRSKTEIKNDERRQTQRMQIGSILNRLYELEDIVKKMGENK